ncbi:hypothetical protein [Psychroflexus maritimus]|uniref:Uncharacterized protein n=1 Tax=Psychroflexus maritimus TaxID=2714865 RepID=A0A967DZC7_9FLAO|nr:hypothetical protein [Psychroflexus maritimus]NGZ90063.1 hypothetical protein [Psychroflexus maritimus]
MIIFTSLSYAQNSTQNWEDLEGTWKYQDEEVEFYLILLYKQIEVRKGKIENRLIGFTKLNHNREELYNRLNNKDFFMDKQIFKPLEIYNVNKPDSKNITPDFNIALRSKGLSGTYAAMNFSSIVNVKCEFNDNTLTPHFTPPPSDVIRPDIVQKREAMYANHIPELPSTWVLERVTADEIKE